MSDENIFLESVTEEELEHLAGERLEGSGFEDETPESDWRQ